MAAAGGPSVPLKEYLKRYESGGGDQKEKKKKKRKKAASAKPPTLGGGILIVDGDPTWQKPVQLEEEEEKSDSDDTPVVDEDIEVKRLKRLEALRSRKPYLSVSEDGSGWVTVPHPSATSSRLPTRNDTPSPERDQDPSDLGDRDLSPPRQRSRGGFHTRSPELEVRLPRGHGESPPARARRTTTEGDVFPPRQAREGDLSPQRRNRRGSSEDISPPRRSRRISPDADISPPRRARKSSPEADISPPRRERRRSPEADISPPRRARRRSPEVDISPPRRARRDSPEADLSPPRRAQRGSLAVDLSPPRRARRNSPEADLSPPRRGQRNLSVVDNSRSLHVRENSSEVDLSPPRKSKRESFADTHTHRLAGDKLQEPAVNDISPPRRRGSGHLPPRESNTKLSSKEGTRRGGLYTGKEMKEEIDRKKAEDLSRLALLDPVKSGIGAEPVYRSQGKRISKEEKMKLQKGEEKPKEKKLEWSKGLAQKREAEARAMELELEKEMPFAKTRDDPELDKMLKDRIRWGDPMAHLVKQKDSDFFLRDLGDDEKMKESGFIIPQTVPNHSWIKRGIDPPPNRYGIRPGRHWDGVDRSTGYEKELFKRQNEKRATQSEAYLWSVADM